MSRNAPLSTDRLATLDLLRLAAALAVLGFHYFFRGAAGGTPMLDVSYPQVAGIAIFGYLGVHLFFLISGFVIAWSAEGRAFVDFAIARFARLYPGFVVCMAASFVVMAIASDPRLPVTAGQFVANFFIVAPALGKPFVDGVYWSIVLEIVFYGWVALALAFGILDRWKLPLVAGWLAVCAVNEFWLGNGALRMLLVTEYGPWFAGGVLVHHLWSRGRSPEALMLLAASFLLSCNMLTIGQGWMEVHYGRAIPLVALVAANAACHALLVAAVGLRRLVPASPLVLAAGGLTYPLYLVHQNAGYLGINALSPFLGPWGAVLLVTVAMLAFSWALWRYIEAPLRTRTGRMLHALAARLRGWQKPAPAVAG